MRLIDADELVRKEIAFVGGPRSGGKTLAMIHSAIRHIVDNAPTVIAEPVRHGKIIETIKDGKHHREFSCCGRDFTQLTMWYMPRFCPNCGAKMED